MRSEETMVASEIGGRILVVDDEEIILDLIRRVLSREGYEVSTVRCAEEAMTEFSNGSHDLLIADMDLCRSDGRELMTVLGQARPPMAIVVMTGFPEERIARFAREHTQGLLEKPFALEQLLTTVRKALRWKVERETQTDRASSARRYVQARAEA
jgi:two-component system cell cycle sensor histidine kinase/response regulator CckA